eukprot:m.45712 g.45712  ORF g.45712 m.45712 type:complete len:388 (+) comp33625_c0_seq23:89-1252(+)
MTDQQQVIRFPSAQMAPQVTYQAQVAPPVTPQLAQTQHQPISDSQKKLQDFWQVQMDSVRNMKPETFKFQELPLARIKKIMKQDEEVKMISAEAPVLFSKAAEIFVAELSLRSWTHTEDNKRRTLQKNDVAMAVSKYDQFDFLIDIVPREDTRVSKRQSGVMDPGQMQYYLQLHQNLLLQQQQQQLQQPQQAQTSQPLQQQQLPQPQQLSQPQLQHAAIVNANGVQIQVPLSHLAQLPTPNQSVAQGQTLMVQAQPTQALQPVESELQHLQTVVVPAGLSQTHTAIPMQTLHQQPQQQQQQQQQHSQAGGMDHHSSQLPVDMPQTIHYVLPHGDGTSGGQPAYLSQLPLQASSNATSLTTVGIEMPGAAPVDEQQATSVRDSIAKFE